MNNESSFLYNYLNKAIKRFEGLLLFCLYEFPVGNQILPIRYPEKVDS